MVKFSVVNNTSVKPFLRHVKALKNQEWGNKYYSPLNEVMIKSYRYSSIYGQIKLELNWSGECFEQKLTQRNVVRFLSWFPAIDPFTVCKQW